MVSAILFERCAILNSSLGRASYRTFRNGL
jgi:hypothetical protein